MFDLGFGPGNHVVSAGDDGTVRIWNVGNTESWSEGSQASNIAFSPDGRLIAISGYDGSIRVHDATTGRLRMSLSGAKGFTFAAFSPTSDELVVARDSQSQALTWNLSNNVRKVVVQLPKGRGLGAAHFDSSGQRVVYSDDEGAIGVKDLRSGRTIMLKGAPHIVWDVAISPDGKQVAAATAIGKLFVWRIDRPEKPDQILVGHHGDINMLGYGPDGRIVTAGSDRTVRVWNPAAGTQVVLRGHQDEVDTARFAPGGSQVISVSDDGTVRLWDARSGNALAVLDSGAGPLGDFAVSRDDRIATLSKAGVVRVFDCEVCGSVQHVLALARARRVH